MKGATAPCLVCEPRGMISMQGNSEAGRGGERRADTRTVLAILGALAAATVGACGDDGTGIGATTVMPTSTGNLTTAADDDDDDDFPDDDDDDNDDDDDDDADSTSTGGGGEGTDSSGGSSSTGCEVGTEGCDCDEDDPPCEDGLECIDDLCAAPLCPDDDEGDPDNDLPGDAIDLGDFDDGGNGDTIMSQLAGTEDVDWFSWTCNDTLIPELDPSIQITNEDPIRVCLFLDCVVGGNPTQFSCGGNATEDMINFEFLDGCCVSDGSSFNIDYNCPDSDNDSVVGYLRVDTAQEEVCVDYQVDFSC